MNRFWKLKRSSVVWQLTASFLLILLIPIICNIVIYNQIRRDIREELKEKNAVFFQNVQRSLEISLNDYSQSVSELSVKPSVIALSNLSAPNEISPELEEEFRDSLKPYYQTMYNAYKFYCCFNNIELIGTANGLQKPETFFSTAYDGLDIDFSDWKKWISSASGDIRVVQGTGTLSDVMPKYVLMKYRMSNNAVMVIMLRDVYLSYNIEKMLNDSAIKHEIFSADGQLLATTLSSDTESADFIPQLTGASGIVDTKLNGKSIVASYSTLTSPGWKLVFYTPEELYQSGRTGMRLVLLLMLAAILVGVLLIPWLVKRQYNPVRRILSHLPERGGEQRENEYAQIESALLESAKQSQSLQQQQQRAAQNDFWIKILNGVFTTYTEEDINKYSKPNFSATPNMVSVLPMNDYVSLFHEDDLPNHTRFNLLMTVLDNMGSELLESQGVESCFLESGGNCVILLGLKSPDDMECLQTGLQDLLDKMREYFSMELCIAVSDWHNDLYSLATAYSEALNGLDYIRFSEETDLLFYEDIAKNQVKHFILETEEINTLCKFIKYAESEKACDFADGLVSRFTHSVNFSPIVFKYYINDIVNVITRNFQEYVADDNSEIKEIYILTLSSAPDVHTVMNGIQTLICSICDKIQKEIADIEDSKDTASSLALQIRDYIDAHYTDPDMCANMVAQEFQISTPYISKIFKTVETGGFINYINGKRIEKAKELLRFSDEKIADIAEQTGFSNTTSFIRLFKKVEGIPPSTYRKYPQETDD